MRHGVTMKQLSLLPVMLLGLAGCAETEFDNLFPPPPHLESQNAYPSPAEPPPPPENAVTVAQFDTASAEDKTAAIAPSAPSVAGSLGTTVASIGDPTAPGFWVETPLVSTETQGRVQSKSTGRTVKVTLKPVSGGSSRISLSALQLLDLDLSGLHELVVFGS